MLAEAFSQLVQGVPADPEARLVIEFVFADPLAPDTVSARIRAALPVAEVAVRTAFEGETDRFHFATFAGIVSEGREALAFEFARALRPAIGALEANPVLTDSLYGAAAIGAGDAESFASLCETPRENTMPLGWVHPLIRTPEAWQDSTGSGVTVAVIDTGHSTHQELAGAIRQQGQRNFVEGGTDASDRFVSGFLKHPGHGTLVCSVIASRGGADASGGVSGPGAITGSAPEATILPIRAIASVISFRQDTVAPAIAHAINEGADVIAMALGGPTRVAATEWALRQAVDRGLVVVCAAGNCWPKVVFPAAYATNRLCTAVAALNRTLTPWDKTGSGPEVTISAPGVNVWGAAKNKASDPDHGIRAAQGTTLATSLTAGAAALWVARHGGRAALRQKAAAAGTTVQAMFVHCLTQGLVPPPVWGGSGKLGAGLLDTARLLANPLPSGTEAPPAADLPDPGVLPSLAVLQDHLANHDPEALSEVGPEMADYAAEVIWLSHRAAARARAAETEGVAESIVSPDPVSPGLAANLAGKPALRAVLRQP